MFSSMMRYSAVLTCGNTSCNVCHLRIGIAVYEIKSRFTAHAARTAVLRNSRAVCGINSRTLTAAYQLFRFSFSQFSSSFPPKASISEGHLSPRYPIRNSLLLDCGIPNPAELSTRQHILYPSSEIFSRMILKHSPCDIPSRLGTFSAIK